MISKLKRIYIRNNTVNPYQDINNKDKLIFIHIPKNAGISIEEALFNKKIGHKSILQFESHDKKKCNKYFKFTVVRNPYDRLVSAFYFLKKGGRNPVDKAWAENNLKGIEGFNEFVFKLTNKKFAKKILNHQHFRPQYKYLVNSKGNINIDFIMKFETLSSDFEQLIQQLNFRNIKLSHKNKSNRKSWEEYYEDGMELIVYNLYKRDFESFYNASSCEKANKLHE